MDREKQILTWIKENPFVTQSELAKKLGLSRSAVAGYISNMMKKGGIIGKAYILPEQKGITCIGGANVDRKAVSLQPIQFQTSNPVAVTQSSGGVARNVAENLGRLGCPVSLLTFVGNDQEGQWLLNKTKEHAVDVSISYMLQDRRTGSYTAILDNRGEMVLALADMQIYDGLPSDIIHQRWSHLASSSIIFADANLPESMLADLIGRCRKEEISLCINPVSSFKAKKLPKSLQGVDVLLLNRDEAVAITNLSIHSMPDVQEACRCLINLGVRRVVLTLGDQGVWWTDHNGEGHLFPEKVKVTDVTGAGDSLVAGVLYGLLLGKSFPEACQIGMSCAAYTLQTNETVAPFTKQHMDAWLETYKGD